MFDKKAAIRVSLFAFSILWLASLPIVLLGIGFSGGDALSVKNLAKDIISFDSQAFVRLWAWWVVLFPLMLLCYFSWKSVAEKDKE